MEAQKPLSPHSPRTGGGTGCLPRHIAIIMDGNGRWAQRRGLARFRGHREGVEAVRSVARAARDLGIEYLTLYSFSTENWSRPESEISELFGLLKLFIRRDLAELHQNKCRIRIAGSRERLPNDILSLLVEAEKLTAENTGQTLVIAFNYGARQEILGAVRKLASEAASGLIDPGDIDESAIEARLHTSGIPDPDLIIRTSGEMRLSNFLLWQSAYSELVFSPVLWPDFDGAELERAIAEFQTRKRRFGGLNAGEAQETGS